MTTPAPAVEAKEKPTVGHGQIRVGNFVFSFLPHHVPGVGPRIFLMLDDDAMHEVVNVSADDARRIADRIILAVCEAEAKTRRALRQEQNQKQTGEG